MSTCCACFDKISCCVVLSVNMSTLSFYVCLSFFLVLPHPPPVFAQWQDIKHLPQVQLTDEARLSVDKVYLISSCHLDLGFADTLVNIVNRYFDEFFPQAIQLGQEFLHMDREEKFVFTTHSYLIWLYLNCPLESGLHCPDESAISDFKNAVKDGLIVWHSFPFNAQPEVYDSSLMDFGFHLTANISDQLGFRPVAMSQRDVPGLSRSVIPIMKKEGVKAITVGVNTACMPPAVPSAFVWRDEESDSEVIGMWHPHGYGIESGLGISLSDIVYVPGMYTALAFAIRSDNSGPPSFAEVVKNYEGIREIFPNAEIVASSYNEFVEELVSHKDLLPVVTKEIGDTWIHGVGSDPWKTTQFRLMMRLRSECLANGSCSLDDPRIYAFSSYLLKYGEHTWGKDIKKYLKDNFNWDNKRFHHVQYAMPNYIDVVKSWTEQRDWSLKYALDALEDHELRDKIDSVTKDLYFDGTLDMSGFQEIPCDAPVDINGSISLGFDNSTLGLASLVDKRGAEHREYSTGPYSPLGEIRYTAYTAEDYKNFLDNYLVDRSLNYAYEDLGKPGLDLAGTTHLVDTVSLYSCWKKEESSHTKKSSRIKDDDHDDGIVYRLRGTFSLPQSVIEYGASQEVAMDIKLPNVSNMPSSSEPLPIKMTVYLINKTSTRIPESLSIIFKPNPQLVSPMSLSISKLGQYVNALDVIKNGSKHVHGSDHGVKYSHPVPLSVKSWDAPILSVGGDNYFPVPMEDPEVTEGFSFNLFNNLWGTNYIMWYPYQKGEESAMYRFTMTLPPN